MLEEIRDVRGDIRDIGGEIRGLREEIRDLHAENMQMLGFLGEVIRRNERAFGEFRDEQRAFRTEQQELRAESRAHTRALFALIDRLEGGGAAPAGA